MKNKYNIAVVLILFVFISIGVFIVVEDYDKLFWVNYLSAMAALIVGSVFTLKTSKTKKIISVYNISVTAYLYQFTALAAAFLFSFINPKLFVLPFLVHLAIHAIFVIMVISVISTNSFVENQQEIRSEQIYNFKFILNRFQGVQDKIEYSSPYKKIISDTYDALASSQIGNTDNQEYENSILDNINKLDSALDNDDSSAVTFICREIVKLTNEHERNLKMRKNFN